MEPTAQTGPGLTPFGKYLLDEEIARGGMARVYLARLRGLGGFEKKLVVKQILPDLARDPRFVEMFVEEAKTLVQMSHPHIVPVYELGVVDGVYFLAMEHVEGATLAEMLDEGPLEPALVAHVGVHICDALQYAHERHGLVHRDVTPRNVIVDAGGHARLLDFGIAARPEGEMEGEVFGSHGYMSPEQARGKFVSPKSDLFSLGTVLYEAATADPAFLRDEVEQTRVALDSESPRLADRAGIPDSLAEIVDEMLEKDPDDRPDSAVRIGQRLRGFLATAAPEGIAPELGTRAESARERRKQTPSTRPPAPDGAKKKDSTSQKSIATSVAFQQILEKHESAPPPALGSEDLQQGTAKMEGRGRSTPDPQAGTMPIEGRGKNRAEPDDSDAPPERTSDPESSQAMPVPVRPVPDSAASRRWLGLAGVVVAGLALAFGVRALTENGAAQPPEDEIARVEEPIEPDPEPRETDPVVEETAPDPVEPDPPEQENPTEQATPPARATLVYGAVGNVRVRLLSTGQTWNGPQRSGVSIPSGRQFLDIDNPALGGTPLRYQINASPGQTISLRIMANTSPVTVTPI